MVIFSIALLVACGGGGSSSDSGSTDTGGGDTGGGTTTPDTTVTTEGQSASAAMQSASLVSSMSDVGDIVTSGTSPSFSSSITQDDRLKPVLSSMESIARANGFSPKAIQSRASGNCPDGGSYNSTLTQITYTDCKTDGTKLDGTIDISAGTGNATLNLEVQNYMDNALTTIVTYTDFNVAIAEGTGNVQATYNGNVNVQNMTNSNTFSLTYADFSMLAAVSGDTITTTTNGTINLTSVEDGQTYTGSMIYTDLVLTGTSNGITTSMSISGQVAISYTPDHCGEGTFVFTTTIPLTFNSDGDITAGEINISINGAPPIYVVYNANGTVTVDGIHTYDSYVLENSCLMVNFTPQVPESSGDTGTGSSDDQLTFTLTWNGSTSDIDSHLTYYATSTPTSSDLYDTQLYYSAGDDAGCYPNDCRASVDIGNTYAYLDIDDVNGYGPEHITMTSMPDGYYVISAYEYSMHNDVTSTASFTVQIGDQLFTFPNHTYSGSDTVQDMVRICDIRVAAGTATVLTPDTSILVGNGRSRAKDNK